MVILYTVYIVVMLYAVPYVPYIGLLKLKWYMTRLQNISVLKIYCLFLFYTASVCGESSSLSWKCMGGWWVRIARAYSPCIG